MEKATRSTLQDLSGESPTGLRILYAEDDDNISWLVQCFIHNIGHTVHLVRDGRQAVEAAQREEFDLVLLDLSMPSMDGIEAAQRIRAHVEKLGKRLPLIAATSHDVQNLGDQWEEGLFDAVLSKPVRSDELARVISSFST